MAVIIDEPTPLARSTASQLIGTLTSMGVVASKNVGVLAQSYISAIYGNGVGKVGETMTIPTSNAMSVLDYAGRILPVFTMITGDTSTVGGAPPAANCNFRVGVNLSVTPQTGVPSTFSMGMNAGFINPITTAGYGVTNVNGGKGWIGIQFEAFGGSTYNISKANLVAGQLPYFDILLELWFGWINPPPPTAFMQATFTPSYQDNTVTLPPPYYNAFTIPRGKPATTRGFTLNNLAPLATPYNLLPSPYGGIGVTTGDSPTTKASLMSFFRQSKYVADGGVPYVYNPADGAFPAAAKVFEFSGRVQVFPPLYYVYGVSSSSTINWLFPSYSANPLDSRP